MNKKPRPLPNIEDATLVACLAPLMDGMRPPARAVDPKAAPDAAAETAPAPVDDEANLARLAERFLSMTDLERERVVAEYPRQIEGTLERLALARRRLSEQYDQITVALTLLERASRAQLR